MTRFRSAGIFLVRGFYSGDRKHAPAFGAVLVTALRAATRTSVSVSTTTPYPGEPVTLSATVSSRSPLFPTGRVTFADASGPLCSGRLSGGTAQCTYTWSAAGGPFTVTGFYGGDAAHRGSAGSSSAITVTKLATTTEITSISPDRVPAGTSATVTVTVTNDTTGAPAPTGTVVVEPTNAALDGIAGYSCTVTLTSASDGTGTCDVTPPTGTYGFIYYDATYSGDTTNAGSTYTGGYMVVVPDITTTAVSFSTAAGTVGTPVTVTATVTNQAGDNISPTAGGTGTVTFSIGSTPIAGCTDVALTYSTTTGNTATCSYTPTATGSVTVTAAYSGDEANLDSSGSGVFVVS